MNLGIAGNRDSIVDEIHRRIGRNLLRFQEMEVALKIILPYAHPEAAPKGVDAMREYRKEHIDLKSLGHLFKQFNQATTVPTGFFVQSSEFIVDARNNLVHHFAKLPGVDLLQEDGRSQVLDWLDLQFTESDEWYQFLRMQSLLVLVGLIESNPYAAAQFGMHYEKLLAHLPPGLEYIDKRDPTRTTWATSRIVRLLQLAELHTGKRDGYALLARAGKFIKEQSAQTSPEEYGLRTLKEVLKVSGMFEVATDDGGSTVGYRSIVDLPADLSMEGGQEAKWTLVREKL